MDLFDDPVPKETVKLMTVEMETVNENGNGDETHGNGNEFVSGLLF